MSLASRRLGAALRGWRSLRCAGRDPRGRRLSSDRDAAASCEHRSLQLVRREFIPPCIVNGLNAPSLYPPRAAHASSCRWYYDRRVAMLPVLRVRAEAASAPKAPATTTTFRAPCPARILDQGCHAARDACIASTSDDSHIDGQTIARVWPPLLREGGCIHFKGRCIIST